MFLNNGIDIEEIYSKYLDSKQEENTEKRYKGNESYYHASKAGFCSRNIYYQSVQNIKETNKPKPIQSRIMRLGTIVHEDFEKAFDLYNNNIYNKLIYNNINRDKKKNNKKEKQLEFLIEGELILDELNVRGFYDLIAKSNGYVYLYDIKTMGSWPWKWSISKNGTGKESHHLQLATYGLAVKKKYGRLDGMYLLYYNKDTSVMKQIPVPLSTLTQAENYWSNIKEEHKGGLPQFKMGSSPVEEWNCSYCNYYDHCKPPVAKKR